MDELVVERVLRAVEQVPAGRVVSYGDLAELVGTSPRHVGAVMRHYGSAVTWWRVVNHAGDFPGELLRRARPHWDDEGIAVKPNGLGCRIVDYRVDLGELAERYDRVSAELIDDQPAG